MQLEAEKIVPEKLTVCRDQCFVELVGVVSDTTRDAVDVKGNVIFLDEVIKRRSDSRIGVEEAVLRHGKAVL